MERSRSKDIGFVLLHGAGLGAWIWNDVLANMEYPVLAVDLPGRGKHAKVGTKGLPLHSYVESVLCDLDAFHPPQLIIVAHSISGLIGLQAASLLKERAVGFIAVGASIPSPDGSFITSLPRIQGIFLRLMLTLAGTRPPESVIRSGICGDLDESCTTEVIKFFVPESKKLYTDKLELKGYPPNSLYVQLTKDKELNASMQRRMIHNLRAKQVIDLDSGHLPMLSKSRELAQICNQYAEDLNKLKEDKSTQPSEDQHIKSSSAFHSHRKKYD